MISNDIKRQKAYEQLRKFTSDRVARPLSVANEDLECLSLAALINILFLVFGDGGSTGNFSVSFSAAIELVGMDLMWLEPEEKKIAVASETVQ